MLCKDVTKILRTGYSAQFQRSGRVCRPAGDSLIGEFLPENELGAGTAIHIPGAYEKDAFHEQELKHIQPVFVVAVIV